MDGGLLAQQQLWAQVEGGVVLPVWATVALGVGLPVLTLAGKSMIGLLRSNRHEDRQDADQVYKQQAATIAAMQARHDHLSDLVEQQGMKHLQQMQEVIAHQAACEEQHKDCQEKHDKLSQRVKELEAMSAVGRSPLKN